MTMEGFITGTPISGRGLGQAIVQFLPALPGEGPPGMPRFMARAMFPGGFVPFQLPAAMAPVIPVQPPIQPPVPAANQVVTRPPVAAPIPRKRVLERGTFPSWVIK